jgi:ubiquitin related modifier 1
MSTISLKIEFGGGLELLFSNKRSHRLTLPAAVPINNSTDITKATAEPTRPIDVTYLIYYLKYHLLKERVELFMEKGTV